MVRVPSNPRQTRLSIGWDELNLEYSEQFLRATALERGICVALNITAVESKQYVFRRSGRYLLLLSISNPAFLFQSLGTVPLPFTNVCHITDASILTLLQLLQNELQTPQLLNQMFARSILQVVTIHVLRQWQTEQWQTEQWQTEQRSLT